jgi:hypothetical protein
MARAIEQDLYNALITSEFDFMVRDVIHIDEIYDTVQMHYHDFCDDDYLCPHGVNQPEWKHTVRTALNSLSITTDTIRNFGIRGFWEFIYI